MTLFSTLPAPFPRGNWQLQLCLSASSFSYPLLLFFFILRPFASRIQRRVLQCSVVYSPFVSQHAVWREQCCVCRWEAPLQHRMIKCFSYWEQIRHSTYVWWQIWQSASAACSFQRSTLQVKEATQALACQLSDKLTALNVNHECVRIASVICAFKHTCSDGCLSNISGRLEHILGQITSRRHDNGIQNLHWLCRL